MKKYLHIFKLSLLATFEYRFKIFSSLVSSLIGIFVIFYIWTKITNDSGPVGNYDNYAILTYFGLSALTSVFFNGRTSMKLSSIIRAGTLGKILLKPINNIAYFFFEELGTRIAVTVMIYFLILPVIFFIPQIRDRITLSHVHWYFLYILFINIFLFGFYWTVGNVSFYWIDISGLENTVYNIVRIFRGSWFPLDLAPAGIQKIFFMLPFSYVIYYPAKLLTKGFQPDDISQGIFVLAGFSILCYVIGFILWNRGLKKYENVGI